MEATIAEWPNQKIFEALKERGEKVGPILPTTKYLYAKKLAKLMEKEATEATNPSKPHKKPLQVHVKKVLNQKIAEDQVENGSSGLIVESPKLKQPKMVSKQIETPSKIAPKTKVAEVINDKVEAKKQTYKPLYTSQSFGGGPTENLLRSVKARRPLHSVEKIEAIKPEKKIPAPFCKEPFWSFQKVLLLIGIVVFFLAIYLLMESNPSNLSLV